MSNLYRFGEFAMEPGKRALSRAGLPVSLTPKAFDVLLFLVQNPSRVVTKEELLQAVWGADTFVEEGNLKQQISHLRKALGDNSEDPRLIVTIARRGYQFTADVDVEDGSRPAASESAATGPGGDDTLPGKRPSRLTANHWLPPGFRLSRWMATAALLAVVLAAGYFYWNYRWRVTLTANDSMVLAHLENQTSDPVFDDALDTALRYEMEQTPYLNILGVDKINGALTKLNLPATTKFTAEVAREVCAQTNSKLVISQSIGDAGNGYRLQMRALDCGSGATLAKERTDISTRDEVIHQLGLTAGRLRARLGEPADSLARFDQPLEKALSPSLEALQTDARGDKLYLAGDAAGAVKLYLRAIELDPNFAVTYARMGAAYLASRNLESSSDSYTHAYQLRDRLTERDRLSVEITYYSNVIGDWEKEYASVLRFLKIFPHDMVAHRNLRDAFVHLGQPGRAADEATENARLQPSAYYLGSAIQSIRFASRFNEAKTWLSQADEFKFDNVLIRRERLIVAFATGDQANVEKILATEEQGNYRQDFLHEHSLIEIQRGRFHSAARLRLQAAEQATRDSGWWPLLSALENAEVGRDEQARAVATKLAADEDNSDRNSELVLALIFARSGGSAAASRLADEVSAERPEDTLIQSYFLPTIRAAIKVREHDGAAAVELLRGTAKYDLAFTGLYDYVYPAYIRGLAYLELGDGRSAAAEFQKLIDNRGFTVRHVIGPLAWLQLGRAQKMMGDEFSARTSYATFLGLWKSADPDIPIYQQAKAEYARLSATPADK